MRPARRQAGSAALAALATLLGACTRPEELTGSERPVPLSPAAAAQSTPAALLAEESAEEALLDEIPAPAGAGWLLPEEDIAWDRAEMLACLFVPQDIDAASLRVSVNGRDRTGAFRPLHAISSRWKRARALARVAEVEAFWRALAILRLQDFVAGDNLLVASYTDESGETRRLERRFRFAPGDRVVRVTVTRATAAGQDPMASARILVVPLAGAPPVNLSPWSLIQKPSARRQREQSWILVRGGEATFSLPRGRYLLIATGGPLDGLDEWEVPAEGDGEHAFLIQREVDLPATSTVDFHVHAAASRDSMVPLEERLWSFLAAGVDVMVASDHGRITDYRPIIAALPAAQGRIASLPGIETGYGPSSPLRRRGHWNFWPLEPDPAPVPAGDLRLDALVLKGEHAPPSEDLAAAWMFDAYRNHARELWRRAGRANGPRPVAQLNHPRGIHFNPGQHVERVHDWFNKVGLDPTLPLPPAGATGVPNAGLLAATSEGTTSLDFDALEIWNRSSRRLYLEVRRDWFSLLNQGHVRTGVANTDTHTVWPDQAGYPLNVVFLPPAAARGPRVDAAVLAEAVRRGRVVGTDGPVPLLTVRAGPSTGGPGDLLTAPDGRIRATVEVRSASWVPVGTIRLWINGRVAGHEPAGSGEEPLSIRRLAVEILLERDSWILAEVGDPENRPDGTTLPGRYGLVAPRGLALAFTNPVLVDVDGNGRFDAPGLEHAALPSLPPLPAALAPPRRGARPDPSPH